MACRLLASLWPAPATFSSIAPGGEVLAGDAGLADRAAALLRHAPAARVVRSGDLIVARHTPSGRAMAAQVPGMALPGLLEADLLRATTSGTV
jgi:hypothetical protein